MQIWLFNQLLEEIQSALAPRAACRVLFQPITSDDTPPSFMCRTAWETYSFMKWCLEALPPPPLEQTVCCLCSPVMAWSSRWGGFVWPWAVWRTPPLILPFESLQRTMANTCEPPKCSIGKKSGGGSVGLGLRSMNAEGEVNAVEAVPCVYARLSATDAWVTNGLGALSPVLPSSAEDGLGSCTHAQAWKYTKVSPQALFFSQQGDRQHSTQHLSDLFIFHLHWPLFFRYDCVRIHLLPTWP